MFYFFIIDLCCTNSIEDPNFCGFNHLTIQILNMNECTRGWFTERRKITKQ